MKKIICDSVKILRGLKYQIKRNSMFSFDAETEGVDHYYDKNTLWTISKCSKESYIIPCEHNAEGFEKYLHLWKDRKWLRAVLEVFIEGFKSKIILGQNAVFDLHRAKITVDKINSILGTTYRIPTMLRIFDTQIAYHTIDSKANVCKITGRSLFSPKYDFVDSRGKKHKLKSPGPYSLKTIVQKFLPNEFSNWGQDLEEYGAENGYSWPTYPFEILSDYAAIDSAVLPRLYTEFRRILEERDLWSYFWDLRSFMPSIFFHITQRGLYVDQNYALETKEQINTWFVEMEKEIASLPVVIEAYKHAALRKAYSFIYGAQGLPVCPFTGKARVTSEKGTKARNLKCDNIIENKGLKPYIDAKGKINTTWEKERLKKLDLTNNWQAGLLLYGCHSWEDRIKNGYENQPLNIAPTWKQRNGDLVKNGVKWEDRAFKGLGLKPALVIEKGIKKKAYTTGEDHIMRSSSLKGVKHIVYLNKLKNLRSKIGDIPELIGKPSKKEKKGVFGRLKTVNFSEYPRAITPYFFTKTARLTNENHSDPSHANSGSKIVDKAIKRFKGIYKPTPIYRVNPKTGREERRVLIKADYKGAEMVALSMFCKEMRKFIQSGGDLHIANACVAAGITLDQFFNDFEKSEQKRMRQKGKAVGFGFSFGMFWTRFVEYARNAYGVEFTPEEAEEIYKRFHERWKLKEGYYKHVERSVEKYGFVRSLLGCTLTFYMGGERYLDYRAWDKENEEYVEKRKFFQDKVHKGWEKCFLGWRNKLTGKVIYRGSYRDPIWTGTKQAKAFIDNERLYNMKGERITYKDIRKSQKAITEGNAAINGGIQMTIPDLIHCAFSYLIPPLEELEAWIIKTTHDSLTIECWEGDFFEVSGLIKKWLVGSQHSQRAKRMRAALKIDFYKGTEPAEFPIELEVCAWSTAALLEYKEGIRTNQTAWLNYLKSTTGDKDKDLEYCKRAKYYAQNSIDKDKFYSLVDSRIEYLNNN